jgi:hypothetical protein
MPKIVQFSVTVNVRDTESNFETRNVIIKQVIILRKTCFRDLRYPTLTLVAPASVVVRNYVVVRSGDRASVEN